MLPARLRDRAKLKLSCGQRTTKSLRFAKLKEVFANAQADPKTPHLILPYAPRPTYHSMTMLKTLLITFYLVK